MSENSPLEKFYEDNLHVELIKCTNNTFKIVCAFFEILNYVSISSMCTFIKWAMYLKLRNKISVLLYP